MSAYLCTDAQIRSFHQDMGRLNDFLLKAPSRGDCYLADFWDGLHFLLAGGPDACALPLAALKVGDVQLKGAAEATHAIFSHTAQAFASALQGLSEATLRERLDLTKMVEARVYPIRPWLSAEQSEGTFRDLMFYYARLYSVAVVAATEGQGLLFSRYEDW